MGLFRFTKNVILKKQSETTTTEEIEPVLFRISQSSDSNTNAMLKQVHDSTIRHSENTKRSDECSESSEPVLFRIARSLKLNTNAILKPLGFCFTLRFSEELFGIPIGQPTQNPQVQNDEVSDSNGNAILDKASSAGSVVASSFCLSGMTVGILAVLTICIFTITPALSAFRCVECPENFFCKNGQKTACPATTPVTNGTQKSLASDCMTCFDKTGNSATAGFKDGICVSCYTATSGANPAWNGSSCTTCAIATNNAQPVYNDLAGGCVSCTEKDSSKPNWNGTECIGCNGDTPVWNSTSKACEACPADKPNWDGTQCVTCQDGYFEEEIVCADGTEWNEETQACKSIIPENAITITTDTGSFYIASTSVFNPKTLGLGLTYSECQAMIDNDKYPEVTVCNAEYTFYDDQTDYWAGAVKYCRDQGKRLPTRAELTYLAQVVYGDPTISMTSMTYATVANEELYNILLAPRNNGYGETSYYSSEIYSYGTQQTASLTFASNATLPEYAYRNNSGYNAFCIPQ